MGFSLVELLVVVLIVSVLLGVLLPSLAMARRQSRIAICGSNLKGNFTALSLYANDYKNQIPRGPDIPIVFYPVNNWSQLGHRLVWIPYFGGAVGVSSPGATNALGVVMNDRYLSDERTLFCPGDQFNTVQTNLIILKAQDPNQPAFCSYLYRQLDQTSQENRFDDLGNNQAGERASAIAFDQVLEGFDNVYSDNHGQRAVNVIFSDGHVLLLANCGDVMVFRAQDCQDNNNPNSYLGFDGLEKRMNQILVNADHSRIGDCAGAPQLP